jgi:hypothetical protein
MFPDDLNSCEDTINGSKHRHHLRPRSYTNCPGLLAGVPFESRLNCFRRTQRSKFVVVTRDESGLCGPSGQSAPAPPPADVGEGLDKVSLSGHTLAPQNITTHFELIRTPR